MKNWLDLAHGYEAKEHRNPVSKLYKRILRLLAMTIFVISYVRTIIHAKGNIRRAPFAHNARSKIFPDAEENIEEMISQRFTKSMASFTPGPDVAVFLESTQEYCRNDAMHSPALKRIYDCDILSLEFSGLHSQAHGVPCEDQEVMMFAKNGDLARFGDIPDLLRSYYMNNNIPHSQWFEAQYPLHSEFSLFSPFFNTEADMSSTNRLGPLPLLNQKMNRLGHLLNSNDTMFRDDSFDFGPSSMQDRFPENSGKRVDKNNHWDALLFCEPKDLFLSFAVFSKEEKTTWWIYNFRFERTSFNSNFYKSYLEILSGTGPPDISLGPTLI
eukprot:GHVP01049225.1.p1 GENE.GHVP01049225.1~~GHVP01049225.1.p1  ORF type:complete len:327 (+),score=53.27 GHVP01049225.1:33-1013(+)